MKLAFALACLVPLTALAQGGQLTSKVERLQSEILVTTLDDATLKTQIAKSAPIEHKSEVSKTGPATIVVRVQGCQKDAKGACNVSADIVLQKPDGTVFQEQKNVSVPAGGAAMALKLSGAASGVYNAVATVRDLTSRRFATVERPFGIK